MEARAYADTAPGKTMSFGERASAFLKNTLSRPFHAAVQDYGRNSFNNAYDRLARSIEISVLNRGSLDAAEPDLRVAFSRFLKAQKCPLALKNFDALLEEKSGDKALRDDGSVSWYHEFLPVLRLLSVVRDGKVSLAAMQPYGGLEVAIASHLRHDSVEDVPKYQKDSQAFAKELRAMVYEIQRENSSYDVEKGLGHADKIITNNRLITQKRWEEDGVRKKENILDYTERMVADSDANPLVFMSKQLDAIHNFATLWTPRFTVEKRLARCNNREDMYGPRYGFTDRAMKQWPECAEGIKALDDMMGFMLYIHFRYLETVDHAYPNKEPRFFPVGVSRYMDGTMIYNQPDPVNMTHIFTKNLMASVDPQQNPEKHGDLQRFIEDCLKPSLNPNGHYFPYLFKKTDPAPQNIPAPVAR